MCLLAMKSPRKLYYPEGISEIYFLSEVLIRVQKYLGTPIIDGEIVDYPKKRANSDFIVIIGLSRFRHIGDIYLRKKHGKRNNGVFFVLCVILYGSQGAWVQLANLKVLIAKSTQEVKDVTVLLQKAIDICTTDQDVVDTFSVLVATEGRINGAALLGRSSFT